MQAITSATGRSRETLLKELTGIRDERVGPIFTYLVKHMDRRKEADLVRAGYRVLRATWLQLERDPDSVALMLRAALSS